MYLIGWMPGYLGETEMMELHFLQASEIVIQNL